MKRFPLFPLSVAVCLAFPWKGAWAQFAAPAPAALEKQWFQETMKKIDDEFFKKDLGLYAETLSLEKSKFHPASMWTCGVQLSALNSAAKLNFTRIPAATAYAQALNRYWVIANRMGGYNPYPCKINGASDRYYDDNEWIVLDLVDLYELTGKQELLRKAEETMKFVLSGEDDNLGGGIYWHEPQKESKNTCSNAPAIAALLRLYMLTKKPPYLDAAQRLYTWMNKTLQDQDGRYYDNIRTDGTINRGKLTYNTALMIRSNCLFYQATGKEEYLTEAKRLGEASIRAWVDEQTGTIKGAGKFSHLLADAFLALNEVDPGNPEWLAVVDRCAVYVHNFLKDANGHYPESWDHPPTELPLKKWSLISQASVARLYGASAAARRPARTPTGN